MIPHPVSAVSDQKGWFRLPRLPDGEYRVVATHELLGTMSKTIKIRGREPELVTFLFEVGTYLRRRERELQEELGKLEQSAFFNVSWALLRNRIRELKIVRDELAKLRSVGSKAGRATGR